VGLFFFLFALSSCRKEDEIILPIHTDVTGADSAGTVKGFFLLNEGNMGSNKASLDYFDYGTGIYSRNIYPARNPSVVKELGDVGNDIQIYGHKLYAVINVSHLVEVMDVHTAKHLAAISIPNCRYVTFDKGYAYVSSYAGPVQLDPNARPGYVAKVDTSTMQVVAECVVGYQPEEMVIRDNKLYVANSGGYRVPNYDNTISVIDLNTFTETKKIVVGINMHRMEIDRYGVIYVTSRGDYKAVASTLYVIGADDKVMDDLHLPVSEMTLCGDSLYVCSTEWSYTTAENTVSYAIINTQTKQVVSHNFITDGTEKQIDKPYGLAVNPDTKEIFVTDAKDYVTPGTLYCFTPDGKKKWKATTGDIPAHLVFTRKKLQNK
jgi:DNA-binding beta-propeller fold protein YncE